MVYRYIAIEGNIGVGKSTLANLLAKHYDAHLVLEEFADNNFLPKFYRDSERYAFPLELSFLADRYKQLKPLLTEQDIFREKIITDYLFSKSKLFARINLPGQEFELFQQLFDIVDLHLPTPDILIYLHAPINRLQQNIKSRGRSYEQEISGEYLEKVQDAYQQYLKLELQKTLIIDTSTVNFIDNLQHFERIIDFLDKDYDFKTNYLSIS